MGDKVSVPITKKTKHIIFNDKLAVCFDSSGEVIEVYELTYNNDMDHLYGEEIVEALKKINIRVSRGEKIYKHQFSGKGFKSADVADYSDSGTA